MSKLFLVGLLVVIAFTISTQSYPIWRNRLEQDRNEMMFTGVPARFSDRTYNIISINNYLSIMKKSCKNAFFLTKQPIDILYASL